MSPTWRAKGVFAQKAAATQSSWDSTLVAVNTVNVGFSGGWCLPCQPCLCYTGSIAARKSGRRMVLLGCDMLSRNTPALTL